MILYNYLNKIYLYYIYLLTKKHSNIIIYTYFYLKYINIKNLKTYLINLDNIFESLLTSKKNTIYIINNIFKINFLNKFIDISQFNKDIINLIKNKFLNYYNFISENTLSKYLTIYPIFNNKFIIVFNTYNNFFKIFKNINLFKSLLDDLKTYSIIIYILTNNSNYIYAKLNLFLNTNNLNYNIKFIKPFISSSTNINKLKNFKIKKFINFKIYNNLSIYNNLQNINKFLPFLSLLKLKYKKQHLINIKNYLNYKFINNFDILNTLIKTLNKIFYINNEYKPLTNFLLCGPSGTGKTELAKILSYILFNSTKNLIKLNMSEYMEPHSISKLIGSPPGYIGYNNTNSKFIETLKLNINNIILFDEIEKADKSINDLMLQILEEGKLTLANGDSLYFNKTFIIFTSNLGITKLSINKEKTQYENQILEAIKKFFRPEFLSRINNILIFKPTTNFSLYSIFNNIIKKINLEFKYNFNLNSFIKFEFIKYVYNTLYGIRPLVKLNNLLFNKINIYNINLKNNNINNSVRNINNLKLINLKYSINSYKYKIK
uniref:ATP-dependent Clp protease n=1 Tax=Babesia gibsoni TaxID=33632 RepID=A0A6M8NR89_BABGI|nr:ATP-dependent Clp protease [Babesia gibsoni]